MKYSYKGLGMNGYVFLLGGLFMILLAYNNYRRRELQFLMEEVDPPLSFGDFLPLVVYLVLFLFQLFLHSSLVIEKDTIRFEVKIHRLTIRKKELKSNQIKEVIFKRVGWKDKYAKIKAIKCFSIRIYHYEPKMIFQDLQLFCEENEVKYKKTKDYKRIQKWYDK